MMKTSPSLSVLASALLVCGCATSHMPKVRPVSTLTPVKAQSGALSAYDLGKSQLAEGNPSLAIESLRKDLLQHGQSTRTLNALAVAYGQLGRSEMAEQYFQQAFQLDRSAPETAYNYSVFKYQQGHFDEARQFADLAASLSAKPVAAGEPPTLRQVVADAAGRASVEASQKLALLATPDVSGPSVQRSGAGAWDLTLADEPTQSSDVTDAVAPLPAVETAAVTSAPLPAIEISHEATASFGNLQPGQIVAAKTEPTEVILAAAVVRDVPPAPTTTPQLRIVNGAGRTHMARRMAGYLRDAGNAVSGLANARTYDQQVSLIRYRRGFEDAALALSKRLPPGVKLVEATAIRSEIELTLGKDLLGFDQSLKTA